MTSIAVIVGSLRRESINRKLALAIGKLAAPKLDFGMVEIGGLPLYNEDLWAAPPEPVLRLKREVEAADGVLFATPEYNRGYSGVIKNAIDWGTRPYGKSSWKGKPSAVIGASQGAIGAAVGVNDLKHVLVSIDIPLLPFPEVYVSFKEGLVTADHDITDEGTKKFLQTFVDSFAAWVEKLKAK